MNEKYEHSEIPYLSEEELEALIEETEDKGLLHAPVYLKDQMLLKLTQENKKQSKDVLIGLKKKKSRQLLFFSVKITAAAAAALFFLAVMPITQSNAMYTNIPDRVKTERQTAKGLRPEQRIVGLISEKSNNLSRMLSGFTNQLVMEERNYD